MKFRVRSSLALTLALAGALQASGCDSDPEGPGELRGWVTSSSGAPAAAIVTVTGSGIVGLSPAGGTRVYGAPHPGSPDTHRGVLVNTTPGELQFRVRVEDVRAALPVGTVLEAVDELNRPVVTGSFQVRISR